MMLPGTKRSNGHGVLQGLCRDCPIKGTDYCHKVNPMAKKNTRTEKEMLREEMDKGQSVYKEM